MTYNSTTTLRRIRDARPCEDGWRKLLAHLSRTGANDEPLSLLTVLDSNGLDDALWVLTYAMPDDRLARHYQAWCAEQALPIFEAKHPGDMRIREQIAMLRNDQASDDDRAAARAAAWHAVRDAVEAGANVTALNVVWAGAWDAAQAAQDARLRRMIADEVTP
jgi:hypothetical protein